MIHCVYRPNYTTTIVTTVAMTIQVRSSEIQVTKAYFYKTILCVMHMYLVHPPGGTQVSEHILVKHDDVSSTAKQISTDSKHRNT